jgi:hypothetical protein
MLLEQSNGGSGGSNIQIKRKTLEILNEIIG